MLTAAAGISLLSVVYLLVILSVTSIIMSGGLYHTDSYQISAYKSLCMQNENRFIRTHVVAYFICLLISDAIAGRHNLSFVRRQ